MASQPVCTVGQQTTGHGPYKPRATHGPGDGGSSDVFVNNKGVNRVGDKWNPHTPPPNLDYHALEDGQQTVSGAFTVFVNNKSAARIGDSVDGGDTIAGGSPNVFIGDNSSIDTPTVANTLLVGGDDVDVLAPGEGANYIAQHVTSGALNAKDINSEKTMVATVSNTTPASNPPPITTSTQVLSPSEPFPEGDSIDSIQLSANYTVGKMTRRPHVTFDHPVRDNTVVNSKLTTKEVVENLKLLAENVIEPIKKQYPNVFVTNSFREAEAGKTKFSQHNLGQACDLQFANVPKSEYYNIALWVKDNVSYDQLLLEYKTSGSGLPWIHISFKVNNRPSSDSTKVLTLLNDKTYAKGLNQLA